jgi:hypothetical protein
MFCYYAAASSPLIPGARAFFGLQGTPFIGSFLCLTAGTLLALPWGLLFTRTRGTAALSVPLCILLTAIPPLGIIGWASPLLSAGVLFPGSKWLGLALIIVLLSLFRFKPAPSVVCLTLCALVFHFRYTQPQLPAGWEAVNTEYGGAGQGDTDFTTEYNTHQSMQTTILESHAAVLLFPEHLVTHCPHRRWFQPTWHFEKSFCAEPLLKCAASTRRGKHRALSGAYSDSDGNVEASW